MFDRSCNSNGYIFEPDIIFVFLLIGIIVIAIWIIVSQWIKCIKIRKFLGSVLFALYISLIPMTFIAAYNIGGVKWSATLDNSKQLIAIKDNNLMRIHGYKRINIDEALYYQFLYINASGEILQYDIPAKSTSIVYAADNYRIDTYKLKRKWLLWWQTDKKYILYIPEGSVTNYYNIDLS